MLYKSHEELHALIDSTQSLKAKSDEEHTITRVSSAEKEQGKLRMMEIYAEAIGCQGVSRAQEFVEKVFSCMRQGGTLDELRADYASRELCHSPAGNDYMCFCVSAPKAGATSAN